MSSRTPRLAALLAISMIVTQGLASAEVPSLTLDPNTGPPTTRVLVSGTGFQPAEIVDLAFGARSRGTAIADGVGAVAKTISVPRSATEGEHVVSATGETSLLEASATFTVVLPSITLDRTEGPPLVQIAVTGVNFPSLDRVAVAFDDVDAGDATADQAGTFSLAVRVPRDTTPGLHEIEATAQVSGLVATTSFKLRIDSWRQYGFAAAHRGENAREDVLDVANVGDLTSAWTTTLESSGGLAEAFSSPAVVDGVVYLGAENGTVYALDAWTGRVRWSVGGGVHRWSSPAVVKGVVYIGGGALSALRASTGAVLWKLKTHDDTWSPAVAGGMAYVGTKMGKLYAVRTSDGTVVWTKRLGDTGDVGIGAAPSVAGGSVYGVSADGELFALDADTGTVTWRTSLGDDVGVAPSIADGVAFVPSRGSLTALGASDGSVLWTEAVQGGLSSPAVGDGRVFVGGIDGLYAFDAATGDRLWTAPLGYCAESSPAVANGVVYVVGNPGAPTASIFALDAATGDVLWDADIGAEGRSDPRVVNGMVYAGSEDGRVYAFALP